MSANVSMRVHSMSVGVGVCEHVCTVCPWVCVRICERVHVRASVWG